MPSPGFVLRCAVPLVRRCAWNQYLPHFPAAVYADVWQPPKIA